MNIFEKMAAITSELATVAKNLDVKAGSSSYKAVSERDIIDAVKPLESKYGIYSYPCDREIIEASIMESENTYGGKTTTKTTFFTRMKTTYMFVNVEKPEERITTITYSEGIDTQDKGSGKAMTYADKYALMKAYKISTGDDPDQNGSEPEHYRRTGYQEPQNAPKQQQETVRCSNCGNPIKAARTKDGDVMAAKDVAAFSIRRYGAAYCASCQGELSRQHAEENKQEPATTN